MDTNHNQLARLIWPELIAILLLAGAIWLSFRAQTPTQEFFLGVLTGMLIVFFAAFTYKASQVFGRKQA